MLAVVEVAVFDAFKNHRAFAALYEKVLNALLAVLIGVVAEAVHNQAKGRHSDTVPGLLLQVEISSALQTLSLHIEDLALFTYLQLALQFFGVHVVEDRVANKALLQRIALEASFHAKCPRCTTHPG